jgi:hypothetical protein
VSLWEAKVRLVSNSETAGNWLVQRFHGAVKSELIGSIVSLWEAKVRSISNSETAGTQISSEMLAFELRI